MTTEQFIRAWDQATERWMVRLFWIGAGLLGFRLLVALVQVLIRY
jgi:hypothetical protein